MTLGSFPFYYPFCVTCPASRRHTAKRTESACELVVSAAGSNILLFLKVLRKLKLSEPPARRRLFYRNAFTTTKNKSYFIKLVNKTIK
jgi:hypothetical protein